MRLAWVLAPALFLAGCRCAEAPEPPLTQRVPVAGEKGKETWVVEGKGFAVDRTYFLLFPDGVAWMIDWRCGDCDAALESVDEGRAEEMAWPLLRHAWEGRLWERAMVADAGAVPPGRVVVSIIGTRKGYRVNREVGWIAWRAHAAAKPR
jgi:hypothetical protein